MGIAISVIYSVRIACRIKGFPYVRNPDKQISSAGQPASVGTSRRNRNVDSLLICRYLEGKCGLVIFLCSLYHRFFGAVIFLSKINSVIDRSVYGKCNSYLIAGEFRRRTYYLKSV